MRSLIKGVIVVFLVTSACQQNNPWVADHIETGHAEFDSSRLCYHSRDAVNGIDLEFLRTQNNLRVYLDVHSKPVPSLKNDPKLVLVSLYIDTVKHTFSAARHEGGQRILLPEDIIPLFLTALKEQKKVRIEMQGYAAEIPSIYFSQSFDAIQKMPFFSVPIKIPL